MAQKNIYANRSEGVLKQIGENTFSNENFVNTIHRDGSQKSAIMKVYFPTPTTVKTLGDTIPQPWAQWDSRILSQESYKQAQSKLNFDLEEPSAEERLFLTRREISQRIRTFVPLAGLEVTTRGQKPNPAAESQADCLAQLVFGIYGLVEKASVGSLKKKTAKLATERKKVLSQVKKALKSDDIAGVFLSDPFSSLSLVTLKNFYSLSSLWGITKTRTMVSDLYHENFANQKEQVLQL